MVPVVCAEAVWLEEPPVSQYWLVDDERLFGMDREYSLVVLCPSRGGDSVAVHELMYQHVSVILQEGNLVPALA